jgi:hypothetical protein
VSKAAVLLGAVVLAAAPTAVAMLVPAPPEDPGVTGIPHCVVLAVRGLRLAAAKRRVLQGRCSVGEVMRRHSSMRRERVTVVVPRAGTVLAEETGVVLVVSSGR